MENLTIVGIISTFFCLAGFYIAYWYGHTTKRFKWSEYILIVIWPLIIVGALAYYIDIKFLILFAWSALFGTLFEFFVGLIYEKTLNKKLWIYKKLSIRGYTSLLSIPMWGIAGVVFWSLGQIIGL